MDKFSRHQLILDLIKDNIIETQKELLDLLKENKVYATQATISRDIKDLRITKIQTDKGIYKYAVQSNKFDDVCEKYKRIFSIAYESINIVDSFIIIRVLDCTGKICSRYIENLNFQGVVSVIYDDDTILVIVENKENINSIASKIKALVEW